MKVFETFQPKDEQLRKYVSYYYIDIAEVCDYQNEYVCYPHYNNTISFYKSHTVSFLDGHSEVNFEHDAVPLQIFTPLRETILKVTQRGPVHKIGIVFETFGVNQFLDRETAIDERLCSPSFSFFKDDLITGLFEKTIDEIRTTLDHELLKLLVPFENAYIEKAIELFHSPTNDLNIDELAELKLGISRKQLNRIFKKFVGTTAQKYRSIVRFRQLMNYRLANDVHPSLTALSHQAHYTDQSHFIKACKQLTGLTPSQFFKEGRIVGSEDTFWRFTG